MQARDSARTSRRRPGQRASIRGLAVFAALVGLGFPGRAQADVRDPFPEIRPSSRAQALDFLLTRQAPGSCSNPRVATLPGLLQAAADRSAGTARALSLLQRRIGFDEETLLLAPGGTRIRFSTGVNDFDRLDPTDRDADGNADRLQAVLLGLEQARGLLVGNLELPAPERLEVVLANLRMGLHGYVVPPAVGPGPITLVLDSGPGGDPEVARRAALQAYAHAVALTISPRFPPAWSDALAHWSSLTVDGFADGSTATCLSNRIARLGEGLLAEDRDLGPGNALWLAFLNEAYDITAVRLTLEALGEDLPEREALDRGLRRSTGDDLAIALREFHVWTLLVGARADEHHFSFAAELQSPNFASSTRGMPALSVQSDPAVGPTGVTQIALLPEHVSGGLRVLFEGEFAATGATWEVDLILLSDDGTKHRLPVDLSEGRGEKTVPLDGLSEAWVLIRNSGDADPTPRRYSYSAHHEKGFPYELGGLEATEVDNGGREGGVLVAWDTDAEHDLFGFNIVRTRESGGQPVIVNPMWIPAMGDPAESTSYRYVDRSAEPGVAYTYAIQAITRDGLTSKSDSVTVLPR